MKLIGNEGDTFKFETGVEETSSDIIMSYYTDLLYILVNKPRQS